ncbi:segregation and condensation protein A [Membranihabitans maritimus]|uniref:segregation and condensation protein A n=1 Tax=Membranihabitans maritimus TaxID=2904244 RepID=UPI001F259132|nr:segregation/condensation protein A [Membranihabitans maritimus]
MFENTPDQYYIKLPQFEGPFDLILFFIERDEIDIQNIPISRITKDFLEYIQTMDRLNIELASEFIVVAATLMRIKTKMLLPRKEKDEDGNEIDPREELVQRLMEYKRFKSVLEELQDLEQKRSRIHPRGNVDNELRKYSEQVFVEAEWESVDLYKLFRMFRKVMVRYDTEKNRITHTVVNFKYTIEDQRSYITNLVFSGERASFEAIFDQMENRLHAIVTFLALLELVNSRKIKIQLGNSRNSLWISPGSGSDEEE